MKVLRLKLVHKVQIDEVSVTIAYKKGYGANIIQIEVKIDSFIFYAVLMDATSRKQFI